MQTSPCFGLNIIDIVKFNSIATTAVSIPENQFIIETAHKHGIGTAIFIFADHRSDALKTRHIEWPRCAKVNQRIHMHIAAQMNVIVGVNGHS